jgi:hypothetical protein
MKKCGYFFLLLVLMFAISACGAEPDVEATVAAAIAATEAAKPTDTPVPPTDTPIPPTETAVPPTNTPVPPTNTPVPPTDTPLPPTETAVSTPDNAFIEIPQENGWIRYELPQDGIAISMPDTWTPLTLDPELIGAAIGEVGTQNPSLESFFTSDLVQNLAAIGIKFYGLDADVTAITQSTPTSLNVLVQDIGISLPFDSFVELNLNQLPLLYGEDVEISEERITIDGLEASRISYEATLANAFGQLDTVRFEQYLLLDGEIAYILTMASVSDIAGQYETLFPEIASTFDILD